MGAIVEAPLQLPRRQSMGGDALAPLRRFADGGGPPDRGGTGGGGGRLGVRRGARVRARLPRRALHSRPDRRGGAVRAGPPRRACGGAARPGRESWFAETGADRGRIGGFARIYQVREERPDSASDFDEPKLGDGRRSDEVPPPEKPTAEADASSPEMVDEAEPRFFED